MPRKELLMLLATIMYATEINIEGAVSRALRVEEEVTRRISKENFHEQT